MLACNGSGWGPVKRALEGAGCRIVLCQEHKTLHPELPGLQKQAKDLGWQTFAAAARVKEAAPSGGVAVLAGSHLQAGLVPAESQASFFPARIARAWVQAYGIR